MSDDGKRQQFLQGFAEYLEPLIEYMEDNVPESAERTNAETRFSEFQFWITEAVTIHGIK